MNIKNIISNDLPSIGISLVLLNTSVGIWANYYSGGQGSMSNIFIIIGLLCTIEWKNLKKLKFPLWNRYFTVMVIFQSLAIIYFFVSSYADIRNLYFHLTAIIFCFALASRDNINEKILVQSLFFISMLTTLCGLYAFQSGAISSAYIEAQSQTGITDAQEEILEPFTVGKSGLMLFCSALLFMNFKIRFAKILSIVSMPLALVLIALCTKRNPLVQCMLASLIFFHNLYSWKEIVNVKNLIKIMVAIIVIIAIIKTTGFGEDALQNIFDNLVAGFSDMWTGHSTDETGSAQARAVQRQMGIDLISHMSFDELLLGAGYMWKWLDVPLIQIICDMGLIGFSFFFYLVLYKPVKAMIKCKHSTLAVLTGLLFSVHLSQCMSSGHPYAFPFYLGPIFLFWALTYERRRRRLLK